MTLEGFKLLLLDRLLLEYYEWRAYITRGRDILKVQGLHLPSITFVIDKLPPFGSNDHTVASLALGNAPFVSIVAVLWLDLEDGRKAKKAKPRLDYLGSRSIYAAEVHLTASDASNL
jgi:hypothetical protein